MDKARTPMSKWRRALTGLAVAAVTLTACGGDDAPVDDSATTETSAASSAVDTSETEQPDASADLVLIPRAPEALGIPAVEAPSPSPAGDAVPYATAVAPYGDFGTTAAPGEFPRTITHAMGTTVIEKAPTRVVVLDVGELDSMVQVGVIPVGAVEYNSFGLPPFIVDQVADVKLVGTTTELNFEAIAALQPDLILSSRLRHESSYDLLAGIADTVFADRPGVAFKQNFALYAEAVGREAEAAEVVSRYETRLQEVSAALGADRPTVSIVQLRPDSIRFYLRSNFLGLILTDVGIPRSAAQNVDDFAFTLGAESLAEYVDGDVVIVAVVDEDANGVLDSPVWRALPAVASGQVVDVDTRTWIGGVGYGSAFEILDQIGPLLADS